MSAPLRGELRCRKIWQAQDPGAVIRCCGDYIVVTTHTERNNLCRVQLYSANHVSSQALPPRVAEWQIPGAADLGDIVAVDSVSKFVYAAHKNSPNVSVLSAAKANSGLSGARQAVAVPFRSRILSIVRFDASENAPLGDVIVVVSESSEIAVLQTTEHSSVVSSFKMTLSFSNPVAAVSKYGKNSLVLTCLVEGHIEVRIVLIEPSVTSRTCRTVEKPAIRLPSLVREQKRVPKVAILGCMIQPQSIFVLYSDGTLHATLAKDYNTAIHKNTLSAWWSASPLMVETPERTPTLKPTSIFKLLPSPAHEVSRTCLTGDQTLAKGGICSLGDHYAVVAYGRYCSIWDSAYHADHGYTQLKEPVARVQPSGEFGEVLLETDENVYAMEMDFITDKGLTLAEAVKRKGCCDAIWRGPGKEPLLKSQPVTVNLLKTAADAGGDFSRVYQKHLKGDDTDDAKTFLRIFMRSKTPTADDLCLAIRPYVWEFGKLRRGNHGKLSDLGLAKLPSEHVAAATGARCLYEIFEGKFEFVVPFIDMVGTGVISNASVLASLGSWDMNQNYKTANISSIATVLARSPKTLYALEAAVAAVPDLPESDIVRAAQMATRSRFIHKKQCAALQKEGREEKDQERSKKLALERSRNDELGRKAHRLLLRCIVARVDRLKLIEALRKMPQHDVRSMLTYFQEILDKFSTRRSDPFHQYKSKKVKKLGEEIQKSRTEEECIAYRGVAHWLDTHQTSSVTGVAGESQELHGCIEWASLVLDAHLASLVLDEEGRKTVTILLKSVSLQRRQSEMVAPMIGALEHIQAAIPLPQHKPLYFVSHHEVPLFAALR